MEDFLKMMFSQEDLPPTRPFPIATLVFMDLESTGLPSFIGKKNVHITEISLIAIDRTDFENDGNLRVMNKLSLCIRPRTQISHSAMNITGLCNDILDNQEIFNDTIPKLLDVFFERLRRPVCLLAHNGYRYDFPLLKAELNRINHSLDNIFCADTWEAFKSIGLEPLENEIVEIIEEIIEENNINTDCNEINTLDDGEINKLLSTDMDIFNSIQEPSTSKQHNNKFYPSNLEITPKSNFTIDNKESKIFPKKVTNNSKISLSAENGFTSVKRKLFIEKGESSTGVASHLFRCDKSLNKNSIKSNNNNINKLSDEEIDKLLSNDMELFNSIHEPLMNDESNELKHSNLSTSKLMMHKENSSLTPKVKISAIIQKDTLPVKRKLFSKVGESSSIQKTKLPRVTKMPKTKSLSLENIYNYYFKEKPPENHHAEGDCIALSKVCQKINKHFLKWLDENYKDFHQIKAMW